jgi:metallo-beta-lactamase family protein
LRDSAHLQEEDAYWANKKGFSKHKPALPLYTAGDAQEALGQFSPLYYGEDFFVGDNIRIKFKDAGHILGSAFVEFKANHGRDSSKILFSGDLGRTERPILREPVQVYNVDYLILESTYGDRLHEEISPAEELRSIIGESIDRGGVLVVPSFSVGRAQTLLYLIRELEEQEQIPSLPIYVDSPMAIDATDIFEKRISDQDLMSRILTLKGKEIFRPKQLHLCKSRDQSKAINKQKSPAIIVSASGMATGGRILHHLRQRLPFPENTILFIGYQAIGTRGRTILEGKSEVKIHGESVPIRSKIESISGFSGHADYNEILAWLMGFNKPPEVTYIVHGEPEASISLADRIRERFGWNVEIPDFGESFEIAL